MSNAYLLTTDQNLPPDVPTSFITNPATGTATPAANVFTFTSGGGITFSTSGSQVSAVIDDSTLIYTDVSTTPYPVNSTDYYLSVDTSGGAITIQLPNSPTSYRTFIIKDRTGQAGAGNPITVTTVGGAVLIDGQPTFTLDDAFDSINLIFNSTSYEIF